MNDREVLQVVRMQNSNARLIHVGVLAKDHIRFFDCLLELIIYVDDRYSKMTIVPSLHPK